jgi:mRNA interferase YafQ
MNVLKEIMLLLVANDGPLPAEWLDHTLTGDWRGHRECHVGGDFLLIYRLDESVKTGLVVFVRSGTHSELFS